MKYIIALLFLLPTLVFSQNNGVRVLKFDVQCVNAQTLSAFLTEFGEKSIFRGISNRETASGSVSIVTVFYFNRETMSWTMVERVDTDLFCVVGMGTDIEFLPADRQNRKKS